MRRSTVPSLPFQQGFPVGFIYTGILLSQNRMRLRLRRCLNFKPSYVYANRNNPICVTSTKEASGLHYKQIMII
jgi:hypothetical protein